METETNEITEERDSAVSELLFAYYPAILSGIFTIITTILYSTVIHERYWSVYFDLVFMAVVQFVIIFLNRRFSLGLPYYLIALMALHSVLSVDMGTSLGFYGRFPWWDTFVHCFFGFLAAATLYYLYLRFKGKEADAFDCLVILLIVLSFAALWELFEYVMGAILKSDMQDVYGLTGKIVEHVIAARNGGSTADLVTLMREEINPVSDTMFDMTVAIVGAVVFFAVLYLTRKIKRKIQNKKLS